MRAFEWHALQSGDPVTVHSITDGFPMRRGVVTSVFGRPDRLSVGVVLDPVEAGPAADDLCWPSRFAVHLEPRGASESCWRCDWPAGRP